MTPKWTKVSDDGPVAPRHETSSAPGDVGDRLRSTRLRKGQTLKTVAAAAGLSESFLSQLERHRVNASVGSLQRIAAALDTTLAELFEPSTGSSPKVVRKDARPSLRYGILGQKSLLTSASSQQMEVFLGDFDIGGSTGAEPYAHGDSEELLFVTAGIFEVQIGDRTYTLTGGDCVNYRSSTPHRAENVGYTRGEVMWIISPPSI